MHRSVTVVVVMGVSGSGKTTIGRHLAGRLGFAFCDADDVHPPANVAKMRSGVALDDRDREVWLSRLRQRIDDALALGAPTVFACSALKDSYRRALGLPRPGVALVHLKVSREVAERRLRERRGHFMPASLLSSQFDALEEPTGALVIDADRPAPSVSLDIERALAAG